jgi:hypothetical protein
MRLLTPTAPGPNEVPNPSPTPHPDPTDPPPTA